MGYENSNENEQLYRKYDPRGEMGGIEVVWSRAERKAEENTGLQIFKKKIIMKAIKFKLFLCSFCKVQGVVCSNYNTIEG